MTKKITLRYGMNPHQQPASLSAPPGVNMSLQILNGQPGYINLLDALNSWQLVRDLTAAVGLPAAASFKHVSPAGAALAVPLSEVEARAVFVDAEDLSPLATAYARARGADRISSFGDWIALSETVDLSTARLIRREVSDGVIAPAYDADALELLKKKKKGSYRVLQIDPAYEPPPMEERQVFGMTLAQRHNEYVPKIEELREIVTAKNDIPPAALRDMVLALIALKYTQSNSVCYAFNGQIVGMGAGQQSRIHCTRLAGEKADNWFLRQHPRVLDLPFKEHAGRPARDNAIDQYLLPRLPAVEEALWLENFYEPPLRLTTAEKREWLGKHAGVVLGSDAFFPFRDSIDRASESGVSYVVQPGGSLRDADVIAACDEYKMAMVFTGIRLFHH